MWGSLWRCTTWSRSGLVPLVVRFGLAVVLLYHGYDKITGVHTEGGAHWQFMGAGPPPPMFRDPKAPPPPPLPEGMPRVVQMAIAYGELVVGLLLFVGFLTRLAALGGAAAILIECAVYRNWKHGFGLIETNGLYNGGVEYTFVLLLICLAVLLAGAGTYSLDHALFCPRTRKPSKEEPVTLATAD
jgi:uncharacterized membrane protein YphA (DoxX/SURF4 family)